MSWFNNLLKDAKRKSTVHTSTTSSSTVTINSNGKTVTRDFTINGGSITIKDGVVFVDGKKLDDKEEREVVVVNITVNGDAGNISIINGDVSVSGQAKKITTQNGGVTVGGDIQGDVSSVNGDIEAKSILGDVSTVNGDISK